MEVAPSSTPETLDPNPHKSDLETPPSISKDPSPLPPSASVPPSAAPAAENPTPVNPSPNPNPTLIAPPPPSIPSFRPLGAPPFPQYTISNTGLQNPSFSMAQVSSIQPPGVSAPGVPIMHPGAASGAGAPLRLPGGAVYPAAPGQPPVGYGQVTNGYMTVPGAPPAFPPPGIARYVAPYPAIFRPGFPPRPLPPFGVIPQLTRPPIPGVRGPPTVTPLVRPVVPIVTPVDKPQTTVYVGKIASTVDNEFLLSLLRLCGPVKSWKRAQDPSDGTPKGFGFCEFESAEGILRAMRLLSKLNIDRQELVLNINQATREYLERYVEKKTEREREKLKEAESQIAEKETGSGSDVEKQEPSKLIVEEAKKVAEDSVDKENHERTPNFGIVTDEDRDADIDALEKITNMIEERLKTNPLPPTPHVQTPVDGSTKSNSEVPSKSRDGDSDVDILKSAEEKNDDETTSENKPVIEHERPETCSPVKGRRHDRRSVERDRGRDMKREKEWQLERYERERQRDKVKRERERELKSREAERFYRDRVKEWEAGEREKEHQRQRQREREKEHQRERYREILKDENESDDGDRSKMRHRSVYEEKRRKRQREKEDDLTDRLKEEVEIAEAKKRAIEEKPSKDDLKPPPSQVTNESDMVKELSLFVEGRENAPSHVHESVSDLGNNTDAGIYRNNNGCDPTLGSSEGLDMKQNSSAPSKKLGFGLIGSGKRTSVPSVFHEEDDEGVDDKKMRPLVPIDYSTEELQAVQSNVSGPPNLVAAAEFAKRISNVNTREDKRGIEREMNGRSNDRLSHRDRDRNVENARARNESKEKVHDKIFDHERDREDKHKTGNTKLLDAKQLIDMIPKTKEELFAYGINWSLYDKYELHERMRPWISKKITEFLGEDEPTLVDYIVSSTKDHVHASKMLELLQSILDDEAEMFVLKMWRMLIFEIKKVETGLSGKSRV